MYHLPDVRMGKEQCAVKLSFIANFDLLLLFQIYTRACVHGSFFYF